MTRLATLQLILELLRGEAASGATHAPSPSAPDWADVLQTLERWRLVCRVMRVARGGPAAAYWPAAVAREFRALTRGTLVRRARAQETLDAIAATLNRAGVAGIFVGDAALAGLDIDAAALDAPCDVLVRPENLALATSLMARQGGGTGVPVVRVHGSWRAAGDGRELTFDQMIAAAKPLAAGRRPSLRAGNAHCLEFLWSSLTRCTDVHALLAIVVAIDAVAADGGPAERALWRAWARSAGLTASSEAAFMLSGLWLAIPPPQAASTDRVPRHPGAALRLLLAHVARGGLRVDEGVRSPAARWFRSCLRLVLARIRSCDARCPPQQAGIAGVHVPRAETTPLALPRDLAVTYDGLAMDGVGAQLQRIYSLYALSRTFGLAYVHTPLQAVNYQGLLPLIEGRLDADFCARYNDFFRIESDPFELEGCEICDIDAPGDLDIARFRQYIRDTGRRVLLRSHMGYRYTDSHPEAYAALRVVSPYRDEVPSGPLRVCVHLRRGDRVASKDPRMMPNAFFIRVCEQVAGQLEALGHAYDVRLHSELPAGVATLRPGQTNLFITLDSPVTLDPRAHALEEFDRIPHLTPVLNVEPMDALREFGTADVLVLSYSCFGYVGGLLNPHGLVIAGPALPPPRNFHAALPGWLVTDEAGNVARDELAGALAAMLQRRNLRGRI